MKVKLEYKILLIIIGTLSVTFWVLAWLNVSHQESVMKELHKQGANLAAESLVSGVRNMMLIGKATYSREIVDDIRRNTSLGITNISVFDNNGNEVYQAVNFEARKGDLDETASLTIESRRSIKADLIVAQDDALSDPLEYPSSASITVRYSPLIQFEFDGPDGEPSPGQEGPHKLGAIRLSCNFDNFDLFDDDELRNLELASMIGTPIIEAYKTIMLSGKADRMADFALRAKELPGVTKLQVFANTGIIAFGEMTQADEDDEILMESLQEALDYGEPVGYQDFDRPEFVTQIYPLRNEDGCRRCHGRDHEMRGAIRLTIRTDDLDNPKEQLMKNELPTHNVGLQMVGDAIALCINSVASFRSQDVFIRGLMDQISVLPYVAQLVLYDRDGREILYSHEGAGPGLSDKRKALIDLVLQSSESNLLEEGSGDDAQMTKFVPIENEARCWTCHNDDHPVRAVIAITTSLKGINDEISKNRILVILAAFLTMVTIWLSLTLFMRKVVVSPIRAIVEVIDAVGAGDLSARSQVKGTDEIADLSNQINNMIDGLMKKFHLEKFVSRHAIEAVDQGGLVGVHLGGTRREVVALFTDIRGFTAFSESVEPEAVVTMLNTYLDAQAQVVTEFGGEIDKYVGDELVAVFSDDSGDLSQAVRRACDCAMKIQHNLATLRATGTVHSVGVGIGLNCGTVVVGAMGTKERMDFTMIGDVVNVAARLCSAARAHQVLVSRGIIDLLEVRDSEEAVAVEPMHLKGKSQPVEVFSMHDVLLPGSEVEGDEDGGADGDDENILPV